MIHEQETHFILQIVGAILAIASIIGFVLHLRVKAEPARTIVDNMNARIRAWWIMIALITVAILSGRTAVIVLFALVSFGALREFISLTRTGPSDHTVLFLTFFLALPGQYLLIWGDWYGMFTIFIPVYGFLLLPIVAAVRGDPKHFLVRAAETQWGLMICVYSISHVPALQTLSIPGYEGKSAYLIVFLLLVVQGSDVLQYVWGKLLGRHRIAPNLSPSKTVEGFVGGIASATLAGVLISRITPFTPLQAGGMALTISLFGFLGGLVMSAIKRDRGVKDWGDSIHGHGGILDRLDSVCFAAPIFFHLIRYYFVP